MQKIPAVSILSRGDTSISKIASLTFHQRHLLIIHPSVASANMRDNVERKLPTLEESATLSWLAAPTPSPRTSSQAIGSYCDSGIK